MRPARRARPPCPATVCQYERHDRLSLFRDGNAAKRIWPALTEALDVVDTLIKGEDYL
jgi:hypothetical protein